MSQTSDFSHQLLERWNSSPQGDGFLGRWTSVLDHWIMAQESELKDLPGAMTPARIITYYSSHYAGQPENERLSQFIHSGTKSGSQTICEGAVVIKGTNMAVNLDTEAKFKHFWFWDQSAPLKLIKLQPVPILDVLQGCLGIWGLSPYTTGESPWQIMRFNLGPVLHEKWREIESVEYKDYSTRAFLHRLQGIITPDEIFECLLSLTEELTARRLQRANSAFQHFHQTRLFLQTVGAGIDN